MRSRSEQPESSDAAHQRAFGNAAAGLIKSLIRARARQEPDFLKAEDYARWGVTRVASENRTCAQLLSQVRRLRDRFERRFFQFQDSICEPASAEEADAFDSLVEQEACFICGDLNEAIRVATGGKNVAWARLADWKSLSSIRDALDKLPSSPAARATGDSTARTELNIPVIHRNPKSSVIEWQDTRHKVTPNTADAFQAMIDNKGQPIGLGKIVRKPKEWLKGLKSDAPELAEIVERAKGNKGYRVTVFDPPPNSA